MKNKTLLGAAAGGLGGALFLALYHGGAGLGLALFLAAALTAAALCALLFWAPAPAAAGRPADPGARELLQGAQARVDNTARLTAALAQPVARKESQECVQLCQDILTLAAQNEQVQKQLPKFFNHYLPMFEQMLANYVKCEGAGVLPSAMQQEFLNFLDVMENALKKLKEKLYSPDLLRLAADMDVLESLYQLDGLAGSEFPLPAGEGGQPNETN